MATYIALLRGINVGGHNRMKMSEVRESFEALGLEQVRTYVQSGNVVFKAAKASPANLSKKIEKRLESDFGFAVPVVVRTVEELRKAARENPFIKEDGADVSRLHVTFLSETPERAALKKLDAIDRGADRFCCVGTEIYLHCVNGMGQTKLTNTALERSLGVKATARNWRTVNELLKMASESG